MANQTLSTRLTSLMREALVNRRNNRRLPVNLSLKYSIVCQIRGFGTHRTRQVKGHTVDVSRNGISLKTAMITIDGTHVSVSPDTVTNKALEIELELPHKTIVLKGFPLRYEHNAEHNYYLVGVKISAMPADDRKEYDAFLKSLGM